MSVLQFVAEPVATLTVRRVSCGRRSVLEDDGHERLPDGALPGLGHFAADAAVGSYLAGGRRRRGEGLGVAGGHRGQGVGVLPNKVAHGACD